MKRTSLALLLAALLVVSACGSEEEADTTAAAPQTTAAPPATEAPADEATTTTAAPTTTTATTQAEEPMEPVTVTLYVGGITSSAPQDYAAQAQGFFESANINIEVVALDGTSQAVQAVAADRSGFAYTQGSILDEMLIADRNPDAPPLIAISAGAMRNPVALMFLEGKGISTPADLLGKTIAVPQGSLSALYLDVFLERQGISKDDVTVQNIGFGALNPALLTGQVDAIVAFARAIASLSIVAPEQGDTIGAFLFAEFGIASPMTGVVIQKRLLDEHPDVARAIAEVTTRSLHFCAVNAEECVTDFITINDGRDFDQTLAEWMVALEAQYGIDPEEAAGMDPLALGWFDPDLIAETLPSLRQLFEIEMDFDPTALYTNEFVSEP
ncbi:MAG: ABC transporter substrate-binding protein [Acidimicrobiia bacterium]|nr:ABC transporter substrate-binding protein [Acidimicrobiia bacterium]